MNFFSTLLVCVACSLLHVATVDGKSFSTVKSYSGEKVVRVFLETPEEVAKMRELRMVKEGGDDDDDDDDDGKESVVDVWSDEVGVKVGDVVDVRVVRNKIGVDADVILDGFSNAFVMIDDVEKLVASQFDVSESDGNGEIIAKKYHGNNDTFYCNSKYLDYDEITSFLTDIVASNPSFTRLISIGETYEGREIFGVEINVGSSAGKRGIYVDGGIHAREWIAPAVALNILLNFVQGYANNDAVVVDLLTKFTVTVVPVLNVDGYTFTWESDRMWRKSRRANPGGSYGVDINRNADVNFCVDGASSVPSSDTYCGPYAYSEIELVNTVNYIDSLGNVLVYWNLHSYGQELIVPYAWTTAVTADREDHLDAGDLLWEGINRATGLNYDGPRRPNSIYSGFAMDAIYRDFGVKYSGLIELRDTGQFGFLLPESQICDNSFEIWQGIKPHAEFAFDNQ